MTRHILLLAGTRLKFQATGTIAMVQEIAAMEKINESYVSRLAVLTS